jgi:hypothetical protein
MLILTQSIQNAQQRYLWTLSLWSEQGQGIKKPILYIYPTDVRNVHTKFHSVSILSVHNFGRIRSHFEHAEKYTSLLIKPEGSMAFTRLIYVQ